MMNLRSIRAAALSLNILRELVVSKKAVVTAALALSLAAATSAVAGDQQFGVDIAYDHVLVTNQYADTQYKSDLDYRVSMNVHWNSKRYPAVEFQMEPFASGEGMSPDSAGLHVGVGFSHGPWVFSLAHTSKHDLDQETADPFGMRKLPRYNVNWIRVQYKLGTSRKLQLF